VKELVEEVWHADESTVAKLIMSSPLFDLHHHGLRDGGNTLWTRAPLPTRPNAQLTLPLPTPKPDRHYGFLPGVHSEWSVEELDIVGHPLVAPFAQPSSANLFPFLIIEVEAEAARGNLYAAEGQVAVAGAHRVASLLWLCDQAAPNHPPALTDALAFSAVVSQRQAVVYVHHFDPTTRLYYMSFINNFYFVKDEDAQGCRDHHHNVAEWALEVQQPFIRDLLNKVHAKFQSTNQGPHVGNLFDVPEETSPIEQEPPDQRQRAEGGLQTHSRMDMG
jgi:hypothetical protein